MGVCVSGDGRAAARNSYGPVYGSSVITIHVPAVSFISGERDGTVSSTRTVP